jgi:hypothetical protein
MFRKIEPAFQSIYNYIVANLPNRVAEINNEVTDGITISNPDSYDIANIANKLSNTALTLNLTDVIYDPQAYGTQIVTLEFSLSVDMQGPNQEIYTKLTRYLDAISNLFFNDVTLGGSVIVSGIMRSRKVADIEYGYVEFECKADVELM